MHRAATASANFHSKIHPRMIFYDFRRLLPTLRFWYWQEWWESYACWETHMYQHFSPTVLLCNTLDKILRITDCIQTALAKTSYFLYQGIHFAGWRTRTVQPRHRLSKQAWSLIIKLQKCNSDFAKNRSYSVVGDQTQTLKTCSLDPEYFIWGSLCLLTFLQPVTGKKSGVMTTRNSHPASIPKGISHHLLSKAFLSTKQKFGEEGVTEIKV